MIRKAYKEDMKEIQSLVDSVFEEQGIPKEWNPIPEEQHPQWYCMEKNGRIVATAAVLQEKGQWRLGRIAVVNAERGNHLGTLLLQYLLKDVFSMEIDVLYSEARDTTVHILKKYGAEITGERQWFISDFITPLRITRTKYQTIQK